MRKFPIRLAGVSTTRLLCCQNLNRPIFNPQVLAGLRQFSWDEKPKVEYYEQDDGPNPKRRKLEEPVEVSELAQLRDEVAQLRHEMRKFRDPKSHPFLEMIMPQLSDEEQRRLREAIREQDKAIDEVEIRMVLPRHQRPLLKRLNAALKDACSDSKDAKTRKELWRYYIKCKANVRLFLGAVTDRAWRVLWESHMALVPTDSERYEHLRILANDMIRAGRKLSDSHELTHIEARFFAGERDELFKDYKELGESSAGETPEYLELGVRLNASAGRVDEAAALLQDLFTYHEDWDLRIIIRLIGAYAILPGEAGVKRAFSLYLQLRERLGDNMTMDDFDAVSLAFMEAGHKRLGLAVFRDMMLCKPDQPIPVRSQYAHVYKDLQESSKSPEEINSISLEAMIFMPRHFQNKYFYAKWLKKLIGMKETAAAAQVIELMYEQGIKPDALHVNGLIGAWLRSGNNANKERAEHMAWSMIHERLEFAWRRRCARRGEAVPPKPSLYETEDGVRIPRFLKRQVPSATIETFSILLQHYLRRDMLGYARHLQHLLSLAEIPMNSYIMNHLMYADLRNHNYDGVWGKFKYLGRTIHPDMESYICLWECAKARVDRLRDARVGRFPRPRELFADMMEWFDSLDQQSRASAVQRLTMETYRQIIRCIGFVMDIPGTLVAMHAIKSKFGLYPDEETSRLLVLLMSRTFAQSLGSGVKTRHLRSKHNSQSVEQIKEVLTTLSERRRQTIDEQFPTPNDLTTEEIAEENLNLFSEFLRVMLVRIGSRELIEDAIETAKEEMKVGNISTGDLNAMQVP